MDGYLGTTVVDTSTHPEFSTRDAAGWAVFFIAYYGQIDGAHHKAWVLDQVARILKGTPVIVNEAKWDNGHTEFRYSTGEPSKEYTDWVEEMLGESDEDGEREYGYDVGIAP